MQPLDRIRENLTKTSNLLTPDEPDTNALFAARSYLLSSVATIENLLPVTQTSTAAAQALRAINSDKQKEAARENGKKGGRPLGSKNKPKIA